MSSTTKDTNVQQQPAPRRKLFKGSLVPPCPNPAPRSYTVAPTPASEVAILKDPAKSKSSSARPQPISSMNIPQPFVDPSVLLRRRAPPSPL
ncbi:hypothetical protein F5Y17DRAFT_18672 [Xylariaceae sp. FL0594]|nr:hypothetical protein F5Y17DRAFT_18672 [Xylariaceae sp. FL0594]